MNLVQLNIESISVTEDNMLALRGLARLAPAQAAAARSNCPSIFLYLYINFSLFLHHFFFYLYIIFSLLVHQFSLFVHQFLSPIKINIVEDKI